MTVASAIPEAKPRFEHADITLADGHRIGVSTCGEGTPFVMIHALGGEGMTYARTLRGIAALGFRVVAVDTAGHGRTDGIGRSARWDRYVDLHRRALDALGIDQAVLAGHSMGGKLALDLAAADPDRALAVLAVNAPIGSVHDRIAATFRRVPVLVPVGAGLLAADIALAVIRSRRETIANVAAMTPGFTRSVSAVTRVPGAFRATISDVSSGRSLRTLRDHHVPTAVIHGDRDLAVWFASGRAAATAAGATLVRVHGGGHVWILEDPDIFPGVVADLLDAGFRDAIDERLSPDAHPDLGAATRRPPALPAAGHRGRTWSMHHRHAAPTTCTGAQP